MGKKEGDVACDGTEEEGTNRSRLRFNPLLGDSDNGLPVVALKIVMEATDGLLHNESDHVFYLVNRNCVDEGLGNTVIISVQIGL